MKTQKMMMKMAVILLCGVVVTVTGTSSLWAAELKIGWVDLQRVIDSSEEGQQAQTQIQQKADQYTQQAAELQAQLEAMVADYKNQEEMLTPEARSEKQDAIDKLQVEYNRFVQDSRDELARIEQRALQELLVDISRLVVQYGEQEGFTLIVEAGNILFGSASAEVTDDIIALYNAGKSQ
jgi:outer membrane protein